jgi:hypothetical protein
VRASRREHNENLVLSQKLAAVVGLSRGVARKSLSDEKERNKKKLQEEAEEKFQWHRSRENGWRVCLCNFFLLYLSKSNFTPAALHMRLMISIVITQIVIYCCCCSA